MPRQPERKVVLIALCDLVLGAVFLGSSRFTMLEHVIGVLSVFAGVKAWREYWRAKDRYEAWSGRSR